MKKVKRALICFLTIVLIPIVLASCSSSQGKEKIVARQDIVAYDGMDYRIWTFYFKDNHVSDMHMECVFSNENDAKKFYNEMKEAFNEYPEWNFKISENTVTYNPSASSVGFESWSQCNYKEAREKLEQLNDWKIVE